MRASSRTIILIAFLAAFLSVAANGVHRRKQDPRRTPVQQEFINVADKK